MCAELVYEFVSAIMVCALRLEFLGAGAKLYLVGPTSEIHSVKERRVKSRFSERLWIVLIFVASVIVGALATVLIYSLG